MTLEQIGTAFLPTPRSTRSQAKRATLMKVLKDVLELDDEDLLVKAVEAQGIRNIKDLLTLSMNEIDNICVNEGTNRIPVPQYQKNLIKILKEWNYYLLTSLPKRNIDWDDTTYINISDFDEFRTEAYDPDNSLRKIGNGHPKNIPHSTTSSSTTPQGQSKDLAYEFRKGIK